MEQAETAKQGQRSARASVTALVVALVSAVSASAAASAAPRSPTLLLPPLTSGEARTAQAQPVPRPAQTSAPPASSGAPTLPVEPMLDVPTTIPAPVEPPAPPVMVPRWTIANAAALLTAIRAVSSSGLIAADYEPDALATAIAAGEGMPLDVLAGRLFTRLASDLRDGRTPLAARVQWFIKDNDAETLPILPVMEAALARGDVAGALAGFEPTHADYAALKAALAATAPTNTARIALIRANLDRWRWMPRDLGIKYLIANVPEYQLRLMVKGKTISTYKVIVGKVGRTATPQLSVPAQGVVIHPPWYLPRSVIDEGVGAMIASRPAVAKAQGYTWTGSGKTLAVTQQPGPNSALGYIKIDMPNPDAIFLHDTPNRNLFAAEARAFSHGCLRTERAMELAIVLGILQQGGTQDELVSLIKAGKTAKVPFKENIPVHIGYWTFGRDLTGGLRGFADIYGRDKPVIASFAAPRVDRAVAPIAPRPPSQTAPAGAPDTPDISNTIAAR